MVGTEAFGGTEKLIAAAGGPWTGASLDHDIQLWEAHFYRPTRTLRGHAANVRSVAFAQGVDLLASASVDGMVKLWNSRTTDCLATLTNEFAQALVFTPDARWLVAGMADGGIRVYHTNDLTVARAWLAHRKLVQSLAFSSDSRWLASASPDQTVAVWDWASGRERRRFVSVTSQYLPLAFLPQTPVLAYAQNDERVLHANVETGETIFQRELFPDGEWLAWGPKKPFYLASAQLGKGDGTFSNRTQNNTSVGTLYTAARGVAVADFNGDGWPDIVVSNPGTEIAVRVFLNNHNGTFTLLGPHATGAQFSRLVLEP